MFTFSAVCNLIEMTMGLVTEASIPNDLRWLPMGMDVNYLKKSSGRLTASSSIDPTTFFTLSKYPGEVRVPVEVINTDGVVVTKADVKISNTRCRLFIYLKLKLIS